MDVEANKLFKIYHNLFEMLNDRGFQVINEQNMPVSINDVAPNINVFKEKFVDTENQYKPIICRTKLNLVAKSKIDDTFIHVFFPKEMKTCVLTIKNFIEDVKKYSPTNSRGIVIIQQPLTQYALAQLNKSSDFIMETFLENELVINITKHVLVPTYILLEEHEKAELLKRFKIKEAHLPRILLNDPISRYYGLKRGNIVKVEEASEIAGKYITYRLVV